MLAAHRIARLQDTCQRGHRPRVVARRVTFISPTEAAATISAVGVSACRATDATTLIAVAVAVAVTVTVAIAVAISPATCLVVGRPAIAARRTGEHRSHDAQRQHFSLRRNGDSGGADADVRRAKVELDTAEQAHAQRTAHAQRAVRGRRGCSAPARAMTPNSGLVSKGQTASEAHIARVTGEQGAAQVIREQGAAQMIREQGARLRHGSQ